MEYVDFLAPLHTSTQRNYLERVAEHDKAACAAVAKQFGRDYWDGDRRHGYGGYTYDGRWAPIAKALIEHYGLREGSRVLDVGCGKAHLLYELQVAAPGIEIRGLDVSPYAIEHAKEEVRPFLDEGNARDLPYEDNSFDLVISLNTLHNLTIDGLASALTEIERVTRTNSYLVVESYRSEKEKANLLYWQLTCECFFTPEEWVWLYGHFGYSGDYSFIYFE
ncbi:MAG: class I SAM-dependent methyltransferase [Verrucomicrobia bacterium]|jgi:ubiquinone/menaquinone biosynthesis C-methylase UbiE|nr:class I SAM-dependent methyltransferase [Verrucomicrobiota bacterium]MBT7069182.1 class I SAM-dependent methyltransferase [Verrucomicrobiota bacterium]MBT7699616.1 class I SAM-dependent methyltransferase [Verrucomicrobiota bacterium]